MSFLNEFGWKKFLFFFKLETGGYAIAVTYIIQTIFIFIMVLVSHATLPFEYNHYQIKYERIEICVVTVIVLTASILLFIGVQKRSHFLILPWLSTYLILILGSTTFSTSEYTHLSIATEYYSMFFVELAVMVYACVILYLLYHVFAKEYRAQLTDTQRTESRVVLSEISIAEEAATNHNSTENIYVS